MLFRESTALICCQAKHPTNILIFFTSLTENQDFDSLFKVLLDIFQLGTGRHSIRLEKNILECKFQILGIKTTVGHYIIIFSRKSSCLHCMIGKNLINCLEIKHSTGWYLFTNTHIHTSIIWDQDLTDVKVDSFNATPNPHPLLYGKIWPSGRSDDKNFGLRLWCLCLRTSLHVIYIALLTWTSNPCTMRFSLGKYWRRT